VHTGRFRVFGGSTTRWGGQALRLSPWDFTRRSWVKHSGWPIEFEELSRYYPAAERFLLLDQRNYDSDLFKLFRINPPPFDPDTLNYYFSKWSPRPNLGLAYRPLMRSAPNVKAILHANLTEIQLDRNAENVTHFAYSTLQGRRGYVTAKQFVLCAGGIETARLLLANNTQRSAGIGNEQDLVGRFLQDHPCSIIGEMTSAEPRKVHRVFNLFHHQRRKYSVRFSLSS
jgi:choline dehydrogenase-like flavoprotein